MKKIISIMLVVIMIAALFPTVARAESNEQYAHENNEDRYRRENEKAWKTFKEYSKAFANSTMGGEVADDLLKNSDESVRAALNTYEKVMTLDAQSLVKQQTVYAKSVAEMNDKLRKTKTIGEFKKLLPQAKGMERHLQDITQRAKSLNQAASRAGNLAKCVKYGAKGASVGLSLYGLYSDYDCYNEVKHKNHASLDFVSRTLRGMSMQLSVLSTCGNKMATIPAFVVGIAKDFSESEYVINLSNDETVSSFLEPFDFAAENMNSNIQYFFEALLEEDKDQAERDFMDGVSEALGEMADTMDEMFEDLDEGFTELLTDWYYYLMYDRCNEDNAGVYKPNIYIYPEETMPVDVTFRYPGGLTRTIPDYSGKWSILADPNGMLHDGVNDWEYLFYECITDISDMEFSEGYVISPEGRYEQLEALIAGYGFNEREVKDFADFWDEKLEQGVSYAAYPILTKEVDSLMPIEMNPAPDEIGRLWFGFQKEGIPEKEAAPVPFERNGYSVLEWGGLFIR